MKKLYKTTVGRLRIVGLLEGTSLLILLLIGVPLKYVMAMPEVVQFLGPVHGTLFLLYIFLAIGVSTEANWPVSKRVEVLLAGLIPFGTFYIDRKILANMN